MSASDPDSTFRVLIVEDHPLMAAATGDLLRSQFPGMSLVVADSATTAIEQAASDDWLRIFVDLCVPGACGLSLLRAFKKLGVVRRCCVVTASRDDRFVAEARRIGLLGYIPKSSTVAEFSRSVRDIARRAGFSSVVRRRSLGFRNSPRASSRSCSCCTRDSHRNRSR